MKPLAVGRTNYAILAIGLASMLVLSLVMKQLLHKADEKRAGPLVHELSATFGGRLDRDSQVVLQKTEAGVHAVVTIYPMMGTSLPKLAQEVGEYAWRRMGDESGLTDVRVICRSLVGDAPYEVAVARPYMAAGKRSPSSPSTRAAAGKPAPLQAPPPAPAAAGKPAPLQAPPPAPARAAR
jgi:hypothetical protein